MRLLYFLIKPIWFNNILITVKQEITWCTIIQCRTQWNSNLLFILLSSTHNDYLLIHLLISFINLFSFFFFFFTYIIYIISHVFAHNIKWMNKYVKCTSIIHFIFLWRENYARRTSFPCRGKLIEHYSFKSNGAPLGSMIYINLHSEHIRPLVW